MSENKTAQAGAAVDWESLDDESLGAPDPSIAGSAGPNVRPAQFVSLSEEPGNGAVSGIDLLRDVEVELTVELGSTRMLIKHILGLRPGSVVELNRLAGEPVDIVINKTLIARGEVVVVDEKFAIRVIEIVPPDRRLGGS
jgi:flagellar motor switch protein FliN/FliY